MLKKNYREIRFLKLTLLQKIQNSREEAHEFRGLIDGREPLEICLSQLQQKYAEDSNQLNHLQKKGRLRYAIRGFSSDENGCLTILWAVGDKDATNPGAWDDYTNQSRSMELGDHERVACTGHMVLSLTYMPQLCGYIACMEEIAQLGSSSLETVLNCFFRKYVSIKRKDETDPHKTHDLVVSVEIAPLASRDFEEVMMGRRPFAIVAETADSVSGFDENFERIEKEYCTLKAQKGTPLQEFKKMLNNLRRERRYQRYTIKYVEINKAQRSLSVSDSDLDQHDLDTFLFSQRDQINLDNSIEQFCKEIHKELERKMRASLLAEQRRILKDCPSS